MSAFLAQLRDVPADLAIGAHVGSGGGCKATRLSVGTAYVQVHPFGRAADRMLDGPFDSRMTVGAKQVLERPAERRR